MVTQVKQIGTTYSAIIDGVEWQGITDASRFWPEVQSYIDHGGTVLPQYTLSEAIALKVEEAKAKAASAILTTYPTYKQINVNALQGYTQAQKDAMWLFINSIRSASDAHEVAISALTTAEAVINYKVIY